MTTGTARHVFSARAVLALVFILCTVSWHAHAAAPPVLAGQVTSAGEGAMEGVLVSARRAGSTITVTVVTNEQGRYAFPASRLQPGTYAVSIRAVGYDLEKRVTAEVTDARPVTLDLKLGRTQDLAAQLTNAEWIASAPGTYEQKRTLLDCMGCHTLERIMRSKHDAAAFHHILPRMAGYVNPSTPLRPQLRPGGAAQQAGGLRFNPEVLKRQSEYLASLNLSSGSRWDYELKTLPRPKGRATRVIMTEYDLPRPTVEPHDVITDAQGFVWYSNFGEQTLGKLDPATGKVVEYEVPTLKEGFPTGMLELAPDREGNWWVGMMHQGGIAKFDQKTGKFQTYAIPKELNNASAQQSMVMPRHSHVDGKVWTNQVDMRSFLRLDLATGTFELIQPFKDVNDGRSHQPYGIIADAQNNLWFLDYADENIGRVDAKTLEVKFWKTPTPRSSPRRGMMDPEGRLWFGEYRADRIGVFDTKTEKFQEWQVPTPWSAPYDVFADRNGDAWTGSMTTDRIARLNTRTGEFVEYLLPRSTNIRKVYVDNSTNPVTFWVGNNHGASIVKLEALD
jgi:streptogramin lyase